MVEAMYWVASRKMGTRVTGGEVGFVESRSTDCVLFFFFFNDTATTEIYTLSLHDALPIFPASVKIFKNKLKNRETDKSYFHLPHQSRRK